MSNHKEITNSFFKAAELIFIIDSSLSTIVDNEELGYCSINSKNLSIFTPIGCIARSISCAPHLANSSASAMVAHLNFVIP